MNHFNSLIPCIVNRTLLMYPSNSHKRMRCGVHTPARLGRPWRSATMAESTCSTGKLHLCSSRKYRPCQLTPPPNSVETCVFRTKVSQDSAPVSDWTGETWRLETDDCDCELRAGETGLEIGDQSPRLESWGRNRGRPACERDERDDVHDDVHRMEAELRGIALDADPAVLRNRIDYRIVFGTTE